MLHVAGFPMWQLSLLVDPIEWGSLKLLHTHMLCSN